MSSVAYPALKIVLEQSREDVIQRQREEIERRKMAFEDLRCHMVRMLAPADTEPSERASDLFGDSDGSDGSDGDGSLAD